MIRIVKMTFREDTVAEFRRIFDERKERIKNFPGCSHVELLNERNVFFTYSIWNSSQDLENYRNSELFQSTWALVKPLFAAKAEAWSLEKEF